MNFTTDEIWKEIGQLHMENAKLKIQVAQYEEHIKNQPTSQVSTTDNPVEPVPEAATQN